MAYYLTPEEQLEVFEADSRETIHWVGDIIRMDDGGGDIIPFRFKDRRYLISFFEPLPFYGGDLEVLRTMAEGQAQGYMPGDNARLVKFYRADAQDGEFDEKRWPLPSARDIYEFCNLLTVVISSYLEHCVEIKQVFYLAANKKLATLYNRIFRELSRKKNNVFSEFEPIREETGTFYGYQRKVN